MHAERIEDAADLNDLVSGPPDDDVQLHLAHVGDGCGRVEVVAEDRRAVAGELDALERDHRIVATRLELLVEDVPHGLAERRAVQAQPENRPPEVIELNRPALERGAELVGLGRRRRERLDLEAPAQLVEVRHVEIEPRVLGGRVRGQPGEVGLGDEPKRQREHRVHLARRVRVVELLDDMPGHRQRRNRDGIGAFRGDARRNAVVVVHDQAGGHGDGVGRVGRPFDRQGDVPDRLPRDLGQRRGPHVPGRRHDVHVHDLERYPAAGGRDSEERGTRRSQRDVAAFVTIDRDGRTKRDPHLIGAARNVEQHQGVLTDSPLAERGQQAAVGSTREGGGSGRPGHAGRAQGCVEGQVHVLGRIADVAEGWIPRQIREGGSQPARSNGLRDPSGHISRRPRRRRSRDVPRQRPGRGQEDRLDRCAWKQVLIERGQPGPEAPARGRRGQADLGPDGRRELEVDECARILGIGRMVGERGRVRPLDEAGQRVLGAREADPRRLPPECRIRRDVRVRERRQIAVDVVRQREKALGDSALLEHPEEREAAWPGHGEERIPECERVLSSRIGERPVEEVVVEEHRMKRLADLQRGGKGHRRLDRERLAVGVNRTIDLRLESAEAEDTLAVGSRGDEHERKQLAEREHDGRRMFRAGVAPQRPSLPPVHVRRGEVDQRHEPGLYDHARVKERGPGAHEVPPRGREPLLHRHAEGADTCRGAERERVDLCGRQQPPRRRGIDRRTAAHRAERRFRGGDLEVIRSVRARGRGIRYEDLADEREPDRRRAGLLEVHLAAKHRARGVPAGDGGGQKVKLQVEPLGQLDDRLRRVDAGSLRDVRSRGLVQIQMEGCGSRSRDDDAVAGRHGDLG